MKKGILKTGFKLTVDAHTEDEFNVNIEKGTEVEILKEVFSKVGNTNAEFYVVFDPSKLESMVINKYWVDLIEE